MGLARSSRPLVGEIAALRDDLVGKGLDHVVLCGMGGSSLAPEVICATEGKELVVLDSSDPDYVRAALQDKLDRTVVVVSSKSGSTVETDSQKRGVRGRLHQTPASTRPSASSSSPTRAARSTQSAREAGYRVVNADPDVGGRYSALTAFGLVPSGLAGVDIEALLDDAESVADLLAADDDANPALRLGAAIGGTNPLRNKLAIVDDGSGIVGFADWAEQLIAESTGKSGTGILPVVEADDDDPEVKWPAPDVTVVRLVSVDADDEPVSDDTDVVAVDPTRSEVAVSGSLGAQMLLWEVATAAAGRLLGINPFDQPDVESAKAAARELLDKGLGAAAAPAATDGAIEIRTMGGDGDWLGGATTVAGALDALLRPARPEPGLRRGDGLPRPALRRTARGVPAGHRAAHGAPDHVRLGAAVPALHRAVPQGRTPGRRLPPDHDGAAGGPRHPRPGVHLRRLHRGAGRRRRGGARGPRAARAPAAPDRP